jgi:hypothetical protein
VYDAVITSAILERLGEAIRDLMNHPGKALAVAGGVALVM